MKRSAPLSCLCVAAQRAWPLLLPNLLGFWKGGAQTVSLCAHEYPDRIILLGLEVPGGTGLFRAMRPVAPE